MCTTLFPLSTLLDLSSFFFSLIFLSNRVLICVVHTPIYLCRDIISNSLVLEAKYSSSLYFIFMIVYICVFLGPRSRLILVCKNPLSYNFLISDSTIFPN